MSHMWGLSPPQSSISFSFLSKRFDFFLFSKQEEFCTTGFISQTSLLYDINFICPSCDKHAEVDKFQIPFGASCQIVRAMPSGKSMTQTCTECIKKDANNHSAVEKYATHLFYIAMLMFCKKTKQQQEKHFIRQLPKKLPKIYVSTQPTCCEKVSSKYFSWH